MTDTEQDPIVSDSINSDAPRRGEGWAGLAAGLTMWTRSFVRVGVSKGLGIMLPALQDQFRTTTWVIGWIASMIVATSGLVGPFAGLLGRRFGTPAVIITCGAMTGTAFILGSFANTAQQLALVLILLAGTGLGVTLVLTKEAIGQCFNENYATATGISRTGSSIGLIAFAPLVQLFLNTYGWRGTMLLIGGTAMHLVVCGALMRTTRVPRTSSYQQLPQDEAALPSRRTSLTSCCGVCWGKLSKNLDLALLGDARYWAVSVINSCTFYVSDMWTIYFVSQAQSKGFSPEEAATFVTVAGVGDLIAKVAQGCIIDRGLISNWSIMAMAIAVNSASYFALPWLTSYWAVMASTFLFMSGNGIMICQSDIVTKQVLGAELLAGAYGWMEIKIAILRVGCGFIPGWIHDTTGSYGAASTFIGCVQSLPIISLVMLKYFGLMK